MSDEAWRELMERRLLNLEASVTRLTLAIAAITAGLDTTVSLTTRKMTEPADAH